jgi:putative transposase
MGFGETSSNSRRPYLGQAAARDVFVQSLETIRLRYECAVYGYVVMLEHVHLLIGEPASVPLATVLRALKLSVAKLSKERPFWMARYYDFNVFTNRKRIEKLKYMHRNPVVRGLVAHPEDWVWSSFRDYAMGTCGVVRIDMVKEAPQYQGPDLLPATN